MSNRKAWPRHASSGWDDNKECTVPEKKGLRNKWPSPIACRLAREFPENRRMMREKKQQMTAGDWRRKAEMHADNLAFAQEHSGFAFCNRRYYRREQAFRLRHMRNAWNIYLRLSAA